MREQIKIDWTQTKKQAEAWKVLFDDKTNELIFGGGAGGAKSFLGCAWAITLCLKYPGIRGLIGRKKLKRLKETTLKTFFEVCSKWGLKEGRHFRYNAQESVIHWANGSEILLKDLAYQPSDPNFDELGSLELTFAFIDEVNQLVHKAWSVVNSRIRYKLDENGLIPKCLGSCNPSKGWVYSYFYKLWKAKKLPDDKMFIQALAKDNPFISRHYINQLRKIKDKATRERLLNGNWEYDDDPACLFQNDVIWDQFNVKVDNPKDRWITGDVSRKGRDKMPIGIWHGLQLKKVISIPFEIKKNTRKSAEFIKKTCQREGVRFGKVILDEDGIGGGVVDDIPGCIGFLNGGKVKMSKVDELAKKKGEYYENYGNLKAQCYFKLAEEMEAGNIGVDEGAFQSQDDKDDYIEELGQIKQKDADKDGKIYIIDKKIIKENIGRSPDFSDMVMMRMLPLVDKKPKLDIIDIDIFD